MRAKQRLFHFHTALWPPLRHFSNSCLESLPVLLPQRFLFLRDFPLCFVFALSFHPSAARSVDCWLVFVLASRRPSRANEQAVSRRKQHLIDRRHEGQKEMSSCDREQHAGGNSQREAEERKDKPQRLLMWIRLLCLLPAFISSLIWFFH